MFYFEDYDIPFALLHDPTTCATCYAIDTGKSHHSAEDPDDDLDDNELQSWHSKREGIALSHIKELFPATQEELPPFTIAPRIIQYIDDNLDFSAMDPESARHYINLFQRSHNCRAAFKQIIEKNYINRASCKFLSYLMNNFPKEGFMGYTKEAAEAARTAEARAKAREDAAYAAFCAARDAVQTTTKTAD